MCRRLTRVELLSCVGLGLAQSFRIVVGIVLGVESMMEIGVILCFSKSLFRKI